MPKPIVVIGSSNTDMVLKVPRVPAAGETILGRSFSIAAGGKGANQAVAAARAGRNVHFISCVGDDDNGRRAVEGYCQDGIDVSAVAVSPDTPTGVALIFVGDDGENSIGVASGANAELTPDHIQAARDTIESAAIVLMQLEVPLETVKAATAIAKNAGVPVMLDPAPALPLSDDLLANVSFLTPDETEAELLTGTRIEDEATAATVAEQLVARGVQTVLLTRGARGVLAATREAIRNYPAFEVEAVDGTAAGDTFNGALAVALSQGRDLQTAIRFASAAAAISVTRLGAQPSIPRRDEIEALLTTTNDAGDTN
jgi:ribokinase